MMLRPHGVRLHQGTYTAQARDHGGKMQRKPSEQEFSERKRARKIQVLREKKSDSNDDLFAQCFLASL